jgi:hypothetical protein
MQVVYAQASAHVAGPDETMPVYVQFGTHWPADDPVVRKNAYLFSDDPRFGLCMSVPLPADDLATAGSAAASRRQPRRPA